MLFFQCQDSGPHPCPCHLLTNARGCVCSSLYVCTSLSPCCGCHIPGENLPSLNGFAWCPAGAMISWSYSPSSRMMELPWCELRASQVLPVGTLGPTCIEVAAGCRPMSLSWGWVPCNTIFLASGAQLSPTRLRMGLSGRYLLEP